jgi:hypothetical protein
MSEANRGLRLYCSKVSSSEGPRERNRSTDPARLKQILDRILSHSGEFYTRADLSPGSQAHLTISPYRLGTVPGGRLFGPGYLAQDPRSAHKTASSEQPISTPKFHAAEQFRGTRRSSRPKDGSETVEHVGGQERFEGDGLARAYHGADRGGFGKEGAPKVSLLC